MQVQFSSVTRLGPTLCDPMNRSTPGLPVHHQLLESTQTHVHWVGDAIQPSHPLSSPSPALNLSQHQGLFQWVSSSHQLAKVLEFQPLMFSSLLSSHYCCLRLEGSVLSTWISVSTYSMNEHCDIFPFKWTLSVTLRCQELMELKIVHFSEKLPLSKVSEHYISNMKFSW